MTLLEIKLSMKNSKVSNARSLVLVLILCATPGLVAAQNSVTVLEGAELAKVVPPGFYFQGQSAPTQMRNSAAARFGSDRYVVAGMVDTSGYSADIRGKYLGFLITDSPIKIGELQLGTGAYGFGFTKDGKFVVLDLSGKEIFSGSPIADNELKRPRPLMMIKSGAAVRFYVGRSYVVIAAN
jgi:hypothetical protein